MKKLSAALALLLLMGGCAPSARTVRPPFPGVALLSRSPYSFIKTGIDALLPDSLFPPAMVGIKVASLDRSESLYDLNADNLFTPASNQKLFTSAASLALLGASFPVSTVLYADTARSSLLIKGFGDPLLSRSDLDLLTLEAAPRLTGRRNWSLGYDVTYFDDESWGAGWAWDDEPFEFQPPTTPLVLDYNTVAVSVSPGVRPTDTLRVRLEEPSQWLGLENRGKTVIDSVRIPLTISRTWKDGRNVVTVGGEMRAGDPARTVRVSLRQPEKRAAALLAERLRQAGVGIDTVIQDSLRSRFTELGRVSHTVDSMVVRLNKESTNIVAEALLKVLGAERRGAPGSFSKGLSVIREFLSSRGLDTTKYVFADGSGLSRYNLSSPASVVALLSAMHRDTALFPAFFASLPLAGAEGTLSNRMKNSAAEGNIRAKTGTETGVTNLSGYLRTRDGELLAFSFMMQNFPTTVGRYRALQDRIGAFLAGMSRESFSRGYE